MYIGNPAMRPWHSAQTSGGAAGSGWPTAGMRYEDVLIAHEVLNAHDALDSDDQELTALQYVLRLPAHFAPIENLWQSILSLGNRIVPAIGYSW